LLDEELREVLSSGDDEEIMQQRHMMRMRGREVVLEEERKKEIFEKVNSVVADRIQAAESTFKVKRPLTKEEEIE
jgi:hypothetical protein